MEKGNFLKSVVQIFNKLSFQQRLLLGVIIVAAIAIYLFVILMMNEPNYSALYTNLAQEDASKVIEYLSSQKVPYKIEDNGQTIRVPKESVYELRLSLASKGIPSSGIVGYEIFDKSTLGMSDFMQKLNYKRALEGELARTIMQQQGVKAARVHIVFPAKSIFKEDQKEPTASVVLKLDNGFEPSQNNVSAMVNLIASSVEGLHTENVTVVDTKGRLLTREAGANTIEGFTENQYRIKSNVENYLAEKAQSLLDNIVGMGNSLVKVNVELNFDQVEKTMETYDPESQVAISEQTVKAQTGARNLADSSAANNENTVTNYEVSKTLQKVLEGTGRIKRVTVAAVVSDIVKETKSGDKVVKKTEPRPEDQLNKLGQLIKQAVGYDDKRKDEVTVVSMPFENQVVEPAFEEMSNPFSYDKISNIVLLVIGFLGGMFVIKSLLKRLKNEKIVIGQVAYADSSYRPEKIIERTSFSEPEKAPELTSSPKRKKPLLEIGDIQDEISDEAMSKKIRHEKIVNYVSKNPSDAAKLINLWLKEDEY